MPSKAKAVVVDVRDRLETARPGSVIEPQSPKDLSKDSFMVYVLTFNGRPIVLGHGKRNRARIIFDNKNRITKGHIKAILVRAYWLFGAGCFERFVIKCKDKAEAIETERALHDSMGGNKRDLPRSIMEKMFSGFPAGSVEHMVLEMALCSSYDGLSDLRMWHRRGIINDAVWHKIRSRLELEDL